MPGGVRDDNGDGHVRRDRRPSGPLGERVDRPRGLVTDVAGPRTLYDGSIDPALPEMMIAIHRAHPASVRLVTLVVGAALTLGGCIGGTSPSATAGGPPGSSAPAASQPTRTTTDWGEIWDALPPSFPVYRGSEPVESPSGPASATLTVPAPVKAATEWWQAALEQAEYSTVAVSGPLEDGSAVIDSTGGGDCRVEVTIAPTGGTTTATILFGAACPYR